MCVTDSSDPLYLKYQKNLFTFFVKFVFISYCLLAKEDKSGTYTHTHTHIVIIIIYENFSPLLRIFFYFCSYAPHSPPTVIEITNSIIAFVREGVFDTKGSNIVRSGDGDGVDLLL